MRSPVEEIKERLDLVEFVKNYVQLEKSGVNYRGLCPFHTEKTPSFFVSPSKQIWHCFGGCGEGGDIFSFVMKIEGIDFPEALRLLAQRAGVVLKREHPALRSQKNRLYDICELAASLFQYALKQNPAVQSYIKSRAVNDATVNTFRLGFAPHSWDFLFRQLTKRGFSPEEIEQAGLAIYSEDRKSWYDRFRSRIIFPIMDNNGRVIGFGGRAFGNSQTDPKEAKYINTPQTLIYDKSRVLYGFSEAKESIRKSRTAVIVEGYMDCILSHQAGVKNTIAVSGTALTREQLRTLRRLAERIITSFDTDEAGDSATRRSLNLIYEFGFDTHIALIPSGKDPADTVAQNPQLWINAVRQPKRVIEFYFQQTFQKFDPTKAEGKNSIAKVLFPFIAELASEIERAHWIGMLAQKLDIPEQAVWTEFEQATKSSSRSQLRTKSDTPATNHSYNQDQRQKMLTERCIALISILPRDKQINYLKNIDFKFFNPFYKRILTALKKAEQESYPPEIKEELLRLQFQGEIISQNLENIDKEIDKCIKELEKIYIKDELARVSKQIRDCERQGTQDIEDLLTKFHTLSQKLREPA